MTLDELMATDRAVITVPEAGSLFDLRQAASYEAASRGDFPTIRVGRRLLVPVLQMRRLLGADTRPANDDAPAAEAGASCDVSIAAKPPKTT